MKQQLLNTWADALESGRYEQAQGALRKGDHQGNYGYCCLGVLKDITGCIWAQVLAEEDGGKFLLADTESTTRNHEIFFPQDYDDPNRERLPDTCFTYPADQDLEEWGLPWSEARYLAEMNDGGYAFAEIAGYIRYRMAHSNESIETA